jgi:hypothetical protein
VTGVGISEINGDGHISIYPNPNSGTFTIETHDAVGAEMTLTDIVGRVIQKESITMGKQPIKLQDIAAGEYYVSIKINGSSYTSKVVIGKE